MYSHRRSSKALTICRKAKAEAIDGKRTDDTSTYSIDDAIRDAQEYHLLCSFYQGLITLDQALEGAIPTREQLEARRDSLAEKIKDLNTDILDPAKAGIIKSLEMQRDQLQQQLDGLNLL